MRIAYLITAYGNYYHLNKLLKALNDDNNVFFVHIDKKSEMPDNINKNGNIIFINRIKVFWGGWSHQMAIINLMNEAVKYHFDYYVLISGTDYPIRANDFLYKKLHEGGEYINIIKGFQSHKPESRVKYYYYDCFDRRELSSTKTKLLLILERWQRKIFRKRHYPFQFIFHGSTWWALSHSCVGYILSFIKNNPRFVRFFKTCWCPEECLIPTVIGNSGFLNFCKGNLTYTDWAGSGPALITKNHIQHLKNQLEFRSVYGTYTPFFARKFNDNSHDVIEQIKNELRK